MALFGRGVCPFQVPPQPVRLVAVHYKLIFTHDRSKCSLIVRAPFCCHGALIGPGARSANLGPATLQT